MDFAVLFAATASHGDHVWAICQVDIEFFLERFAELFAAHFSDERCKCRSIFNLAQRKAACAVNLGVVVVDGQARFRSYKFRDDQKLEWFTDKRRPAKPLQIQHRKHRRTLHEHTGISSARGGICLCNYSRATRTNVATIRAPATNVPRKVPETLDSPPLRRR